LFKGIAVKKFLFSLFIFLGSLAFEESRANNTDAPTQVQTYQESIVANAKNKEEGHYKNGLPKIVIGTEDAPYSVVMFFAPTCSHCAHYEADHFPGVYKEFIERNIVKFYPRAIPINASDLTVIKLLWARGGGEFFKHMILFLTNQAVWLAPILEKDKVKKVEAIEGMLGKIPAPLKREEIINALEIKATEPQDVDFIKLFALLNGFSIEEIVITLNDKKLEEKIIATRLEAVDEKGKQVGFVPAFLVNGELQQNMATVENLKAIIAKNHEKVAAS
jgi:protein-disulfide isomerase